MKEILHAVYQRCHMPPSPAMSNLAVYIRRHLDISEMMLFLCLAMASLPLSAAFSLGKSSLIAGYTLPSTRLGFALNMHSHCEWVAPTQREGLTPNRLLCMALRSSTASGENNNDGDEEEGAPVKSAEKREGEKDLLGLELNIDGMSEAQLRELCTILLKENSQLKLAHHDLNTKLWQADKENKQLQQKIFDSYLLVEQNEELKKTIILLQKENEMLKEQNEFLIIELKNLQERVHALEARNEPITIRKAIRVLESFICFDAVGLSKNKFKNGRYNFDAFEKNATPSEKASLQNILSSKGLTPNHLKMMGYLKDCGDYEAHSGRSKLTKDEWFRAIVEDDQEQVSSVDDEDEKRELVACIDMKKELLAALETYILCPPGEVWDIEDPVNKPKKKKPCAEAEKIGAK